MVRCGGRTFQVWGVDSRVRFKLRQMWEEGVTV